MPAEEGGFDPARAVRDGLMRDLPDAFAERRELNAVSFESVNPLGNAVYEIDFENLTLDVMIGMRDESTVASLNYRVTSLPDPSVP